MVSKSRKSKLQRYKSRTSKKMRKSKSRKYNSRKSKSGGSNSKITPNRATKKIQDAARIKIAQTRKKTKAAKKILTNLKNLSNKRPTCGLCLEKVFDGISYTELCGPNHPFHRECVDKLRKEGIRKCPICRQMSPNDIDIPVQEIQENIRIANEPYWRASQRRSLEDWNPEDDNDDPANFFGQALGIEVEDLFYHIDMQLMISGVLNRLIFLLNNNPDNFSLELANAIRLIDTIVQFIENYPANYRDVVFHENDDEYMADDISDAWINEIDDISMSYLRGEYNLIIDSDQFRDAVEFLHPI